VLSPNLPSFLSPPSDSTTIISLTKQTTLLVFVVVNSVTTDVTPLLRPKILDAKPLSSTLSTISASGLLLRLERKLVTSREKWLLGAQRKVTELESFPKVLFKEFNSSEHPTTSKSSVNLTKARSTLTPPITEERWTLTELINVETPSEVSSSPTLSAPTLRLLEPPALVLLTNKSFNGTTSWEEEYSA